MDEEKDMYIVAAGNPFDGMEVYGPFDDGNDANEWAEHEFRHGGEWWVMKLRRVSEP